MSLIPPQNFAYVEPDLYRSATPSQASFSFLQTLKLKTLIYLATDEPSNLLLEFLKEQKINFFHLDAVEGKSIGKRLSEQLVLKSLELMLNVSSYPILVCCNEGVSRTGSVIGCLRKLQRWSLNAVFDEFRRFCGGKAISQYEQFIELFDIELVHFPDSYEKLPFKIEKISNNREESQAVTMTRSSSEGPLVPRNYLRV